MQCCIRHASEQGDDGLAPQVFFKLFALGTYRFLRDGFNVLDIIVIPAAIISQVGQHDDPLDLAYEMGFTCVFFCQLQLVVAVFNLPPTVIQKLSFIR